MGDIVLTEPGLSTIVTAIVTSRKIFQRMKNFVIYRVACTEQLLFFFFISCVFYHPSQYNDAWPQHFALPVIALVTITILNDGTIISVAFDNVMTSKAPEEWNLKALFIISSAIGGVALISSLILLTIGLHSGTKDQFDLLDALGMGGLSYGQLMTMMYLKVSLSDYLSLFNARTRSWMWTRKASGIVYAAGAVATIAATMLARFWPFGSGMEPISWGLITLVWFWSMGWAVV